MWTGENERIIFIADGILGNLEPSSNFVQSVSFFS